MRRIVWAIIVIAVLIPLTFVAPHFNRPFPSKTLPLKLVTWKEIGQVEGCKDFDGDGNDELLVVDKQNQWWLVWWEARERKREKLPVPKYAWLNSQRQAIFEERLLGWQSRYLQLRFVNGRWQVNEVEEPIYDWQVDWGWQKRRKGIVVAYADFDGDKKLDRIEWKMIEGELRAMAASGLKLTSKIAGDWAVKDLNGDGKVEFVGFEFAGNLSRFICWHFDPKTKTWRSDTILLRSEQINWFWLKFEKGLAFIASIQQGSKTQIWQLVWQGDKWRKKLKGEIEGEGNVFFVGRDWIALTKQKPPHWWLWMRKHLDKLLQRLKFHGFPQIDPTFRLMGELSDGRWVTLMRFKERQKRGMEIGDLDKDGLREIALVFSQPDGLWFYVGRFVSGQWWLGKVKLPEEFSAKPLRCLTFRSRSNNWVLWQDANYRCAVVTLRR